MSEQDAVEQVMSIADALEPLRGTVIATGELADGTDTSVPMGLLIDGVRALEQEIDELERELALAQAKLGASQQENEALREFLLEDLWQVIDDEIPSDQKDAKLHSMIEAALEEQEAQDE